MTKISESERALIKEWDRFVAKLPELMGTLPGRWVVFKDGAVVSDHEDEEAALEAAMNQFAESGFIVAQVVKQKTARIPG